MVRVIHNFRVGKTTRRGEPLPPGEMPLPETVTAVSRDAALDAFGCRSREELTAFLRRQRTLSILIADCHRLTKRVRLANGRHERCYVVRGSSAPQLHTTRMRVFTWQ